MTSWPNRLLRVSAIVAVSLGLISVAATKLEPVIRAALALPAELMFAWISWRYMIWAFSEGDRCLRARIEQALNVHLTTDIRGFWQASADHLPMIVRYAIEWLQVLYAIMVLLPWAAVAIAWSGLLHE